MSTQTPKPSRRRLAVKLNADSRVLVYGTVALVTALAVTSLIASFSGLLSVADWARLDPRLRWTVPVMLDGAITVYTAAALIRRARGESTRLAWAGVIAGTLLSASANAVHVLLSGETPDAPWIRGVGAGIAALSPVLAALAVHQLADLAVAGPDEELAPTRRSRRSQPHSVQAVLTAASSSPDPHGSRTRRWDRTTDRPPSRGGQWTCRGGACCEREFGVEGRDEGAHSRARG
ncbi:DUF2637 domain-containing protein [Cellulomonas sp. PSBB021]|uniref:DUF2637 domain-containing protein n=1 Tax=Cellulomonas sp. PSBB021 TaxID=2003551 RepID=UPI0012FD9D1D|nr:DUF2637 domain-containing protein [Cellulomonas sp. PSBB021]